MGITGTRRREQARQHKEQSGGVMGQIVRPPQIGHERSGKKIIDLKATHEMRECERAIVFAENTILIRPCALGGDTLIKNPQVDAMTRRKQQRNNHCDMMSGQSRFEFER